MTVRELIKLPRLRKLFQDCKGFTPRTVELLITSKCNMRCQMCNVWKFPVKNFHNNESELSTREVENFLEKIARLGVRFLCLSGGEPTLRSDLLEIIRKAKEVGLKIELITNGTFVKPLAEKLVKSGVDIITFSIDGSNPKIHDFIRGVRGSWEKAVEGIKSVSLIKTERGLKEPRICIDYVVTRQNYEFIAETVDLKRQWGFADIHFLPILPKTTRTNNLLLSDNDLEKLWGSIPKIKGKFKKNKLPTNSLATLVYLCKHRETTKHGKYAVPVRRQIMCFRAWEMATIDPFGNVYPCCYASTFQNLPDEQISNLKNVDKFNMGTLKESTFEDIWNGDKFVWFRRMSKQPLAFKMCEGCNYSFMRDMFLTGLFSEPSLLLKYINERVRTLYNVTQTIYSYS
jgi:MoaA/NifB/PqqE/SkfB family radical SAM enzyme